MTKPRVQTIIIIVASFLLVVALVFGVRSGKATSNSKATVNGSKEVLKALKYYYQDQGEYPSADQFYNELIFSPRYIDSIPMHKESGGKCEGFKRFSYTQKDSKSFELRFCLAKAVEGFEEGVNVLNQNNIE